MENRHKLLCWLVATFALLHLVQAQDQQGFISLDCGLSPAASPYTEPSTGLIFTSDESYVESGESGRIRKDFEYYIKPFLTMRYFPEGTRNCYNLNVTRGVNYLIKATFAYGNYDSLNNSPTFDLYLGPNVWTTVDLSGDSDGAIEEIIHVASSNTLEVCLVKTGATTPMISALELRPLRNDTYITASGSLKYLYRWYLSNTSDSSLRYPDDVYDRKWYSYFQSEWTQITTSRNVNTSNIYEPPQGVMATAATPADAAAPLTITWNLEPPMSQFYMYVHFAEIQSLSANETRAFNVLLNGNKTFGPYSPKMLQIQTLSDKIPEKCDGGKCVWQLVKAPNSTLPPLFNALEIFTVIEFPLSGTDQEDVVAIKSVKDTYELSRISWQGDPCVPKKFAWDGLNCSYTDNSTAPRIISLDLSSSGLTGTIEPNLQNLTELQELDLSSNNLTGEVPGFLAGMKSLSVINLSGNNLSGSVPQALLDRQSQGLELKLNGNPKLVCQSVSCDNLRGNGGHRSKNVVVPVAASVASLAVLAAALGLLLFFKKNKQSSANDRVPSSNTPPSDGRLPHSSQSSIVTKNRVFDYSEVEAMTNNFQRILGKRGFGVVDLFFFNIFHSVVDLSNG